MVGRSLSKYKICWPKLFPVHKNFCDQKFFWTNYFFSDQNFFRPKIFFWIRYFFQAKNLLPKIYFGQNCLSTQENFLDQTLFWTKSFLDQIYIWTKHFLGQNLFWTKKDLGKILFYNFFRNPNFFGPKFTYPMKKMVVWKSPFALVQALIKSFIIFQSSI